MPQSRRFRQLESSVRSIGRTYLSFQSNLSGNYSKRQLSLAAAYTVFCHAEVEVYLEDWAFEITQHAKKCWGQKLATLPLVHLCTFHEGKNVPEAVPNKDIWSDLVIRSILKHESKIKNNHGIKTKNVVELFAPIGFDVRIIEPVLLADLSAFSVIRGEHAHSSTKKHLGVMFDPFDRRKKVENILNLLRNFDSQLIEYKKSI